MITRLFIKDFRCIREMEVFPKLANLFNGEEESGKTSILNGMRYLLTGRTEWTDGKGSGIVSHVRDGQPKATIEAATDTGEVWTRTIPQKGGPELPWSQAVIDACLCNRGILDLDEDRQKNLFFDLFKEHATPEKIVAALSSPEFPDLAEWWAQEHQEKATAYPATKDRDSWYNYAYDMRSKAKGELKAKQDRHKALTQTAEPRKVSPEALHKAEGAWQKAIAALSAAEAQAGPTSSKEMVDRLKRLVECEEATIKDATGLTKPLEGSTLGELKQQIADLLPSVNQAERDLKALLDDTAECPEGFCARVAIRAKAEAAEILRKEYRALQDLYSERLHAETHNEAQQKRIEHAEARRAESLDHLASLQAEGAKGKPADIAALRKAVSDTKADYDSFRQADEAYRRFADTQKERRELSEEIGRLERECARWEALANKDRGAFAPSGIKAQLLEKAIDGFTDRVNERLTPLRIKIFIDVEPWQIRAQTPGSASRPTKYHSHSAQARISAAIQAQIAIESGLNMIALDEHGMGPLKRRELVKFLLGLPVQSFVFTTLQTIVDGKIAPPSAVKNDNVRVFHVLNGTAETIQAEMVPAS